MRYVGNVGGHGGKWLWQLVKKAEKEPAMLSEADAKQIIDSIPKEEQSGKLLGKIYTEASRALEEDESLKQEVSVVQQKLEARDPGWLLLWQETRRWSLSEMSRIFQELGVQIARQYLESEVVDRGQQMVDELLASGIAKESEGAIGVDLEEQDLGVFLIRKADGPSL